MTQYQASAALLRTRLMLRPYDERDHYFETGQGTKPASKAYEKQSSARAAERVLARARRRPLTSEQRSKEIQRRRKWASAGNMPPEIRACYSEAERATLCVIAKRCSEKGFCDLCIDEIARLAGVGRTSVQNALRKARSKGVEHISVRERPQRSGKSLTNIIKIVSSSWRGWIEQVIGFKRLSTSVTKLKTSPSECVETEKSAFERECAVSVREPSNRPPTWQARPAEKWSRYWRTATTARG
jgi:DNA-binding Lrp family transcriptional regulator